MTGELSVTLDPLERLARLCPRIPPPGLHLTRLYGACAHRTRGTRARHSAGTGERPTPGDGASDIPTPWPRERRRQRAQSRRRSFSGDVADQQRTTFAIDRENVVVVTADVDGRNVQRREREPSVGGHLLAQKPRLNLPGPGQLLFSTRSLEPSPPAIRPPTPDAVLGFTGGDTRVGAAVRRGCRLLQLYRDALDPIFPCK